MTPGGELEPAQITGEKGPGPQLGPALIMIPADARNKQRRRDWQAKLAENIGKPLGTRINTGPPRGWAKPGRNSGPAGGGYYVKIGGYYVKEGGGTMLKRGDTLLKSVTNHQSNL